MSRLHILGVALSQGLIVAEANVEGSAIHPAAKDTRLKPQLYSAGLLAVER